MPEYFIRSNSFAAPMFSDDSDGYVEAATPQAALEKYAAGYKHPYGLYSAACYPNADAYHKNQPALAKWVSNALAKRLEVTEAKGSYAYLGINPYCFEVDGRRYTVDNPRAGSVILT